MKRLAKDGMPDAAYTIATWMDESQYGFSRNLAKSFVLYNVAAKGGIRDAVFKMGLHYETIGDHANALKCIKKASEQGIVHATLVSPLSSMHLFFLILLFYTLETRQSLSSW